MRNLRGLSSASHTLALAAFLGLHQMPALASSSGVSPQAAFESAVQHNETVQIQDELVAQSDERYAQAKGAIYPTVTGIASHQIQEKPSSATGASIFPASQTTVRINATQPLFRGLREYALLRQQRVSSEGQRLEKDRALVQIYSDLISIHFQVLSLEQDLRNFEIEIEVNLKREAEVKTLSKVGRTRPNDLISIETNLASLRAQVELTRGQLSAARESWSLITGLPSSTPLEAGKIDADKPLPSPLSEYLASLPKRPDLRSQELTVQAADEGVVIARGGHLPNIDLSANYWIQRPGVLSTVSWDASIAMTLPIFAGGTTSSQLRQAHSAQHQSELLRSRSLRAAEQEIRSLHQTLTAEVRQLTELEKASLLAEKNYQQFLRDYRLGLATNVEVLQSLTTAQEARRLLDRGRLLHQANTLRIDALSGRRLPFGAHLSEGTSG